MNINPLQMLDTTNKKVKKKTPKTTTKQKSSVTLQTISETCWCSQDHLNINHGGRQQLFKKL